MAEQVVGVVVCVCVWVFFFGGGGEVGAFFTLHTFYENYAFYFVFGKQR